jgi:toxin ParE1/3/4
MTTLRFEPDLAHDLIRIVDHLDAHEAADIPKRLEDVLAGFEILLRNPRIGRPTIGGNRELVIGADARGYIALYRYNPSLDEVVVLAIRAQREAGFRRSAIR